MQDVIKQLLTEGKGILALDESINTANKRLEELGLEKTPENRRRYKELFLYTKDIENYISGIILQDEIFWQSSNSSELFPKYLSKRGILPGIKVDEGLIDMEGSKGEKVSTGLNGLSDRLKKYAQAGAVFAKWRSVFEINEEKDFPSDEAISQNALILSEFAQMAQEQNIVPIIEPEILMDGNHSSDTCAIVTEKVLGNIFSSLSGRVNLSSLLVKTNMIVPGKESEEKISSKEVADKTIKVLKVTIPENVGGVLFLSGGQSAQQATANLDSIAEREPLPWPIGFSFARAIQKPALEAWMGNDQNLEVARKEFILRLMLNSFADLGAYEQIMEADLPSLNK